jgi:hypothetical protein
MHDVNPALGLRSPKGVQMTTLKLIEYAAASAEVRAVYDDIMATRKVDWINNFWKALAGHPPTLKRTWESVKQVMAPGALDPLTKEMLCLAVSATNGPSSAWRTRPIRWPPGRGHEAFRKN